MRLIRSLLPATLAAVFLTASVSGAFAASHSSVAKIQFGTGFKKGKLHPVTSDIPIGKPVAWSTSVAKLSSTKLTLKLTQTTGPGPHPKVIKFWTVKEKNGTTKLSGEWTVKLLKSLKLKTATYEVDYVKGKTTIATGTWKLLKCGTCKGGSTGY